MLLIPDILLIIWEGHFIFSDVYLGICAIKEQLNLEQILNTHDIF